MKEECLICKAPLEYLKEDIEMECELCHKKEKSKTRCINGHYVCNECHMQGIDSMIGICMGETSENPAIILNRMMSQPFCHMHGPEHHVMVGMALLTAYRNSGGDLDLERALIEMNSRGKLVPGGACGFWGACGAGISAGMFLSIVTGSTPLGGNYFGLSHKMTARALGAIGEIGGPRAARGILIFQFFRPLILSEKTLESIWSGPEYAVPTAVRITSVSGNAVRSAERKRRLLLSVSIIPAGARSPKRWGRSIYPIFVTAVLPEQKSGRRSIRMR